MQQRTLRPDTASLALADVLADPPFRLLSPPPCAGNELDLALDVYRQMLAEGCAPNLVTYNTLIDVYGKTGAWEEAVRWVGGWLAGWAWDEAVGWMGGLALGIRGLEWGRSPGTTPALTYTPSPQTARRVLDALEQQGIDPEIRTYNTVIIACNMSGQVRVGWWGEGWRAAFTVHPLPPASSLLAPPARHPPPTPLSSPTFHLQATEALRIYERMLAAGAQPTATTYTALISAYGKNGQLDKALQIFQVGGWVGEWV